MLPRDHLERQLLYLIALASEAGLDVRDERDIHRIAIAAQRVLDLRIHAITRPITYSSSVADSLRALCVGRDLEDTMLIRDSQVPRYEFSLTLAGRLRATLIGDRIEQGRPGIRKEVLDVISPVARRR